MLKGLCATMLICALVGACSFRDEKKVVTPQASASDTCVSQGYASGTPSYDDCVARQASRR
jgi:hypothetical protein